MLLVGRIDQAIFSCISPVLVEEVAITEKQIAHCNLHDNAFERYAGFLGSLLASPDYIFEDKHPNTGIAIKRIPSEEGRALQVVLRIRIETDPQEYMNSIISCWVIGEQRLDRYLRNRKVLYRNPEI